MKRTDNSQPRSRSTDWIASSRRETQTRLLRTKINKTATFKNHRRKSLPTFLTADAAVVSPQDRRNSKVRYHPSSGQATQRCKRPRWIWGKSKGTIADRIPSSTFGVPICSRESTAYLTPKKGYPFPRAGTTQKNQNLTGRLS